MQSLLSIVLCVGFSMHLNLKMVSFLCVWIICFEIGLICRESFTTITLDMSKLKHKKRIQQVKNLVKPPSPWRISKSNQKKSGLTCILYCHKCLLTTIIFGHNFFFEKTILTIFMMRFFFIVT